MTGPTGPYPRMPGGGIARRPLHFIILADCSGGMKGEKIQALNFAIADMLPHLAAWERDQEQAQVFIRAIAFATEPWWHIAVPQPVAELAWKPLQPVPKGLTNMGPAFALAAQALAPGRIERRALRPAMLLITDGLATVLAADDAGEEEAERAGQELARAVVADWRSAVAGHLELRPYTVEERFVLDRSADTPVIPYGSTLLVAVITGRWLLCAQIGDGDMLAVRPDGGSCSPVAGDDRLDGRRTTSLCQPDALGSFRTGAHDLRRVPLAALLLATDGYGNAQADEPWQPSVGRDLAELAAGHDRHWFGAEVPGWAQRCASAEGSGDDTTIALLLPGEEDG